jgi:hypothetical protein
MGMRMAGHELAQDVGNVWRMDLPERGTNGSTHHGARLALVRSGHSNHVRALWLRKAKETRSAPLRAAPNAQEE